MQGRQQHVEEAADPGPVAGVQNRSPGCGRKRWGIYRPRQMAEQHPVGVERPFGSPVVPEV